MDGIDTLHIGSTDLGTEMGIPGEYQHPRVRAAKAHGKAMGAGGVREDLEFQTWLPQRGVRWLTGRSDTGDILRAGRRGTRQLRALPMG